MRTCSSLLRIHRRIGFGRCAERNPRRPWRNARYLADAFGRDARIAAARSSRVQCSSHCPHRRVTAWAWWPCARTGVVPIEGKRQNRRMFLQNLEFKYEWVPWHSCQRRRVVCPTSRGTAMCCPRWPAGRAAAPCGRLSWRSYFTVAFRRGHARAQARGW